MPQVKAEYAMEKFIVRVEEVKESLNAVVATCYDEALSAARQLDKELDMNPGDSRFSKENMPLLGVPLSVKESFGVKGRINDFQNILCKQVILHLRFHCTYYFLLAVSILLQCTGNYVFTSQVK